MCVPDRLKFGSRKIAKFANQNKIHMVIFSCRELSSLVKSKVEFGNKKIFHFIKIILLF